MRYLNKKKFSRLFLWFIAIYKIDFAFWSYESYENRKANEIATTMRVEDKKRSFTVIQDKIASFFFVYPNRTTLSVCGIVRPFRLNAISVLQCLASFWITSLLKSRNYNTHCRHTISM